MAGALSHIRVLDLSRVLAGPSCTQILGDLGADIIKIEKPGEGDDTRGWGPPFLKDTDGNDTTESAYYLSCNRNKRSVAIDIKTPEGQVLIHKLLEKSDVLIENFKTGGLEKYGLGYEQLKSKYPQLIYTSITGFGQTGPLAHEPGYDLLAQAMSGLMAITGEPDGMPMKVGVALSDIMTGMMAAIGTLSALQAREKTGKGQMVDVALLDTTVAALTNIAQYYLTSGKTAPRRGNAHSTIVPYQAFEAADGHIVLAVGNNSQFAKFATFAGHPEWAEDERFSRNSARVANRDTLVPMIADVLKSKPVSYWVEGLTKIDVPCGPVQAMDQVFAMDQIRARGMAIEMPHPLTDKPVKLVGSPLHLSDTPVDYKLPPPPCGQHTAEVLEELLDMDSAAIDALKKSGIVQ
ncbi:MAG: CoA transferase [Alphaproteobacteria bacterium]|nr:CoA transferase [Alphaproteobacteria bacterium]MCD8571024.1 CoA transferase [Alphaproteobacteria bacterium]